MSCAVSDDAYSSILFHASRHPANDVLGVLLSPLASTASPSDEQPVPVSVTRAVPLLHHWTTLSPILEVALELVSNAYFDVGALQYSIYLAQTATHAKDNNLTISGVYWAPRQSSQSAELPKHVKAIASEIRSRTGTALVTILDGSKLTTTDCLSILRMSDSDKLDTLELSSQPDVHVQTLAAIKAGKHRADGQGDFDDHCQDSTIDWLK